MTFVDTELRERLRLDSIICILDADQVFANPEHPALMDLKLRQVGFSDMVILNKVDLVDPEQLQAVRAWIDGTFRRLRIVETTYCNVPLEILLSVGRLDPAGSDDFHQASGDCDEPDCRDEYQGHDHTATFRTWSYETERPLSLEALREAAVAQPTRLWFREARPARPPTIRKTRTWGIPAARSR
jgi:G3E family GTPase